jgi:hypothetical protein
MLKDAVLPDDTARDEERSVYSAPPPARTAAPASSISLGPVRATLSLEANLGIQAARIHSFDAAGARQLRDLQQLLQDDQLAELAALEVQPRAFAAEAESRAYGYYATRPSLGGRALPVYLAAVRDGLLLLLLLVTCLGVLQAAGAYSAMPQTASAPIGFLAAWQTGFGGTPGTTALPFASMLQVDFFLLALAGVCATSGSRWRQMREGSAARRAAALREQIEAMLWELHRHCAVHQRQDAIASQQGLTSAVTSFREVSRELLEHLAAERVRQESIGQRREAEFARMNIFTEGLSRGVLELRLFAQDARQSSAEVRQSVEMLTTHLAGLKEQQGQVLASLDQIGAGHQGLLEAAERLGAEVRGSVEDLKGETIHYASNLNSVAASLREIGELSTVMLSGESTLREAMLSLQDLPDQQRVMLQDVRALLDETVAVAIDGHRQTIENAVRQVGRGLDRLQSYVGEVANRTATVGEQYDRLLATLETISSQSTLLAQTAQDMGHDLSLATGELNRAADQISNQMNNISGAVQDMGHLASVVSASGVGVRA